MALSLKAELRTSQSLVMTPQLMQAIKLLQMSSVDLAAFVDAELERNPLLEREETGEREGETPAASDNKEAEATDWHDDEAKPPEDEPAVSSGDDLAGNSDDPAPAEAMPPPRDELAQGPTRSTVQADDYNLEAFIAERKTLADHLSEQLSLIAPDPATKLIGAAIIGEVDDDGYLRTDLDDIAQRLGTAVAAVQRTLAKMRSFEPTGVFARDLADCLAMQLREKDRFDPAMQALVDNLGLVARRDYAALKRCCAVDDNDLADMIDEIRALNPKPGADFDPPPVQTVIPDIMVTPGPDGGWKVELNSETLPRLLVNQSYFATVSKGSRKDADRAFISERFQTAKWLVDSLDRRARTILKVASEIVRQQDAFFIHGVEHLRPLNLRTVADAIDMHESTVSRVTSNKYMATNRGIFELKYFFTSAIQSSAGGESHSAEAVRHRIRNLIENEADSVLSDDAIVKALEGIGIGIARRTVAKYREAMHIPSSVERRRGRRPPAVREPAPAVD
jgi:RNA polymerase sigma-54 factor